MDQLTLLRAHWDRAVALLALSVAALTLVVVWWRTSGQSFPTQQVPSAFSSGVVTVLLLLAGVALWVSAALRDEWRRLHAIERRLAAAGPVAHDIERPPVTAPGWRPVVRLQADRVLAIVLGASAVGVATVGWYQISGQSYLAAQLPYVISAGVTAAVLAGGGAALWISADLIDQWRLLDRVERQRAVSGPPLPRPLDWAPAMDELAGSEWSLHGSSRHTGERVFTRSIPWRVGDLLSLIRTLLVATGVGVTTWVAASGTDDVQDQVTWTAVGLGAGVVAGVGYAAWILVGLRTVRARRRVLIEDLAPEDVATDVEPPAARVELVAAGNMTRYHLSPCPLAQGKSVKAATAAAHHRAGRQPCGVCRP